MRITGDPLDKVESMSLVKRRELLGLALLGASALALNGAPALAHVDTTERSQVKTITNVSVFDGEWLLDADSITIEKSVIEKVGRGIPTKGELIDGRGAVLLPGLIDAHVHASSDPTQTTSCSSTDIRLPISPIHYPSAGSGSTGSSFYKVGCREGY
jgi:hypothetical protein